MAARNRRAFSSKGKVTQPEDRGRFGCILKGDQDAGRAGVCYYSIGRSALIEAGEDLMREGLKIFTSDVFVNVVGLVLMLIAVAVFLASWLIDG